LEKSVSNIAADRQTKTFMALVALHCLGDCYGGVWPMFKYLHGVDLEYAGIIGAVAIIIGQGLQPIFGLWADHGYQRRLILLGTSLSCLSMLLGPIGLAQDTLGKPVAYGMMFAIMLVVRTGQGLFHPAGTSVAGNWSHARRSTAVATFIAAGMIGMGCSQGLFSQAYRLTGGNTQWMLLPACGILLVTFVWCHPRTERQRKQIDLGATIRNLAPVRGQLVIIYLYQALFAAVANVIIFLMPEFMEIRRCPSWMVQGGGLLVWIAGSVLLMVPVGHLADRFGRLLILRIATVLAIVFYVALACDITAWIELPSARIACFFALLLLAGGFVGVTNPLGVSLGQQLAPRNASVISGILMGLAWAFGSVAMWIAGRLVKEGISIDSILTGLTTACVLALALTFIMEQKDDTQNAATNNCP